VLIIVRTPKFEAVTKCQGCGSTEFDLKAAKEWKWAFACTECGRVKHATQDDEPKYEDGNLIVTIGRAS
jgi:uncharacterized Zn finger protein